MDEIQLIFPQELHYPNDFSPLIIINHPQLSLRMDSLLALQEAYLLQNLAFIKLCSLVTNMNIGAYSHEF